MEAFISPKFPHDWPFDPNGGNGIGRCTQVPRGNCPNQDPQTSWIDITSFDRPGGGGSNLGRCNPSNPDTNWGALTNRLNCVNNFISTNCSGAGAGGGGQGQAPPPDDMWASTTPCYEYTPSKTVMVTCRIRCYKSARDDLVHSFTQSGNHQSRGIGCAMKCLLAHEMEHCASIYGGNFNQGTVSSECAAYKVEAQCLQNTLSRKPP